jgi:hypothetical protein
MCTFLAQRFGKQVLVETAATVDGGFDRSVLAQMMGSLARFEDDEIPLPAADLAFFAAWAKEL